MIELADVKYKVVPVAMEDAMHLYLSEDHIAQIVMLLRRDPAQGRLGKNGFRHTEWRQFRVQFSTHFGSQITVYLLRIKPGRKKPSKLAEVLPYAKELSIDIVKSKVKDLIEGGEN